MRKARVRKRKFFSNTLIESVICGWQKMTKQICRSISGTAEVTKEDQ